MELSYFTAEEAGVNQSGKSDGVLALSQALSLFYMVESVVISELVVQLYVQALVPFLRSPDLAASLSSPLGTCLTPRNHRVGKRPFCHSPGDSTSASDTSAYLCLNFLHSSLETNGFSLLALQSWIPLTTDRSIWGFFFLFLCGILSSPEEMPG